MRSLKKRPFLVALCFYALLIYTHKVRSEEIKHELADNIPSDSLNRIQEDGSTTKACWHYQLMQINDYMINSPENVADYVLLQGKKKFKNNVSIEPFKEMMKGSRLEVFQTESSCDLVIAFRGTFQNALTVDLLQDLNFIPNYGSPYFHPGFYDVAKSYRSILQKVIGDARKKCGSKDLGITVTGHSLGGAIAYVVANILTDLELGKPELVLFGSPRVVRHFSKHTDVVKPVHYYLDRDPVVLTPPAIMFRELTDDLYRFNRVPVTAPVSVTGHQLFQNHLPSEYVKKMALWCKGKELPKKVPAFMHTLKDAGFDATQRVVRTGVDVAGDALLPNKNKVGGTLPPVSESFVTYFTAPDYTKGVRELRNWGDGRVYAAGKACEVFHLWGSKTRAGRNYYCQKTVDLNENAKKMCVKYCGNTNLKPDGCFQGCHDHFRKFCIGNWACPGEPLRG